MSQQADPLKDQSAARLRLLKEAGGGIAAPGAAAPPRLSQSFGSVMGELYKEPGDELGAVHRLADKFQKQVDALSYTADGTTAAGVRLNNSAVLRAGSAAGQSRKDQDFRDFMMQLSLQQYIDELRRQADWYAEKAREAAEKIEENTAEREGNFQFMEDMDDIRDEYHRTGKFDKEKAQRILNARGITIDQNADIADYLKHFQAQEAAILRRNEQIETENERLRQDQEEFERKVSDLHKKADEYEDRQKNAPDDQALLESAAADVATVRAARNFDENRFALRDKAQAEKLSADRIDQDDEDAAFQNARATLFNSAAQGQHTPSVDDKDNEIDAPTIERAPIGISFKA